MRPPYGFFHSTTIIALYPLPGKRASNFSAGNVQAVPGGKEMLRVVERLAPHTPPVLLKIAYVAVTVCVAAEPDDG